MGNEKRIVFDPFSLEWPTNAFGEVRTENPDGQRSRVVPSVLRTSYSSLGFVGREEAMSRMQEWLEKILRGERQIVFVTGEPGIGKTALVDTFAHNVAADRRIWIVRAANAWNTAAPVKLSCPHSMHGAVVSRATRSRRSAADTCAGVVVADALFVSPADRELLSQEVSGA